MYRESNNIPTYFLHNFYKNAKQVLIDKHAQITMKTEQTVFTECYLTTVIQLGEVIDKRSTDLE